MNLLKSKRHHSVNEIAVTALVVTLFSMINISAAYAVEWPWQRQVSPAARDMLMMVPQIQNVTYVPAEMRLLLRVDRPNDVSIYSPMRDAHTYQFYVNNARIVGNSTIIPIQGGDPYVRDIRLEQRSLGTMPAVLVTMNLIGAADKMSFNIEKLPANGAFSVAMRPQGMPDGIAMLNYSAGVPTNPVYRTGPVVQVPQFLPQQSYIPPVAPYNYPPPQPPINNYPAPMFMVQPTQPQYSSPPQLAFQPAAVGVASSQVWPVVNDIVAQARSIHVSSLESGMTVERVFSLTAPNRYVVDITPAKLSDSLRNRLLLDDPSTDVGLRTSQLDEDTVRVVLSFKNASKPVQLSQENQNRLIKLTY